MSLPAVTHGAEGRGIEWKLRVYNTILHILTNPIYAGAYAFGRTGSRVSIEDGRKKITRGFKKERKDWEVLIALCRGGCHRQARSHRSVAGRGRGPRLLPGPARSAPRAHRARVGAGRSAIEMARRVGMSGPVAALDPSAPLVGFAREAARRSGVGHILDRRLGRAETLPFPDGTFDRAFCRWVLLHIKAAEAVVNEMRRGPHGRPHRVRRGRLGVPKSFRYRVTNLGLRVALFFSRAYNRLLRPGLAAALPGLRALSSPLKRVFDQLDTQINASIAHARLAP